jgi:hypothetical protein
MSYESKTYQEAGNDRRYQVTEFATLIKEFVFYIEPETYVELGVRDGYMFNQISPLVKRAVACDIAPMPNVIRYSHVEVKEMTTFKLSSQWTEPIDMLFIDADHHRDSVLNDFDRFSPFVKECTGVIFLHDTYPRFPELTSTEFCNSAWEAAWKIRTDPEYKQFEIFTIPGPYAGLSLIRKAPKNLHWK